MTPTVCAVMLVDGRLAMVERAKESFMVAAAHFGDVTLSFVSHPGTIGAMRNAANAQTQADIIIHWDSDDWSHPERIAEQVKHLQVSGADCVGYNEMLFWREEEQEAWLYLNNNPCYALGTSLCYWRRAWERLPFADLPNGPNSASEFHHWFGALTVCGISSLCDDPRMIASIHEDNTSSGAYRREVMAASEAQEGEWRRVPQWDEHCRETMRMS